MVPGTNVRRDLQLSDYEFGSEQESQHHFRDYWLILMKRKWWVLSFFLGVVIIVGLYTFMVTPIYRGFVTLQLIQDNPSALIGEKQDPFASIMGVDTQAKFYETQFILLNSRPMALKIVEALNLRENPLFKKMAEENPDASPQEIDNGIAGQMMLDLEVKPIKKSFLVEIAYLSPDKKLAQEVPNAIYREYLQFSMETRQQSYKLIKEWLENELHQLASKVEASEQKVYDHGKKKDFLALEGEDNVIVKKFVELNKVLTTAQSEKQARAAQYQQIKEKGVDSALIVNNPLIQKLREDKITQEAKISNIQKTYGKNYPQLQAEQAGLNDLNLRLNNEVNRLKTSIKADYEIALRTENLLTEEYENQKNKVSKLQDNMVQHNILKRDLQTNDQLYQALLARMKEASVASTMVTSNVAIIEPAALPRRPYTPKKARNMALAAFIGLLGGVGLAFLMEYFDSTMKTSEEMERVCRIPALGVVPFFVEDTKEIEPIKQGELALSTFEHPKSAVSEAINHITASIMLSQSGGPPQAIMMASANPSEGKTTLSVNLASSMAINGRKVILIDADMRRPVIHKVFKINQQPGLSNFLVGDASLEDAIRSSIVPNLSILPAGTIPPSPVQLLNSQAFKDLVKILRRDYQNIIFDTPPIIGFADGRTIASLIDGVCLVFKHHSTTREAGHLARQLLSQVNAFLLGGVFNMVQKDKIGYGGYYGYYKYYSKTYGKYTSKD